MQEILRVEKLVAGYGNRKIVNDITFSLNEGKKILLVGPNGCGKSTLLKSIAGALSPMAGTISFKGSVINNLSMEERIRLGIGYLSQSHNIFPSLTLRDNLSLAFWDEKEEVIRGYEEKLISLFPFLKEFLDKKAGVLSGGQRQALAVGMIILKEKELYLLDEPTAGLSPKSSEELLSIIKEESRKKNISFLMVEHNLRFVEDWYDEIIVMVDGRIMDIIPRSSDTSPREILERHIFQ